jgi:hypothetical protein
MEIQACGVGGEDGSAPVVVGGEDGSAPVVVSEVIFFKYFTELHELKVFFNK